MPNSTKLANHTLSSRIKAYLEVMRPANIVTAFADILAGFAAAGGIIVFQNSLPEITPAGLGWLLVSTFGLYGGGVVFNDFFDAELDAEERPERPIPSGRATKTGVGILGTLLLLLGIIAAFQVSLYSSLLAILIAACAVVYDAWAKHSTLWGPLFMGSCRGGNLLLGCSIIPFTIQMYWFLALIPIAYIGSITLISQGEVHGGTKRTGVAALVLIVIVVAGLLLLELLPPFEVTDAIFFIAIFATMVIPPFVKAAFKPSPEFIRRAVKRGILSLIILNSAIAAGFGGIILGIVVLALLPVSILFSKIFAVT